MNLSALKRWKTEHPPWLVLCVVLGVVLWSGIAYYIWENGPYTYNPFLGGFRKDTSLHGNGGVRGSHLTVDWPASSYGKYPGIRLRVPREYVHESTTYLDKKGDITKVAIGFEVPGHVPIRYEMRARRSGVLNPDESTEERVRRFFMDMRPGVGQLISSGRRHRLTTYDAKKPPEKSAYVPHGEAVGLERFVRRHCGPVSFSYGPNQPILVDGKGEARRFKESDDPTPPNCFLWKEDTILLSSETVSDPHQQVAIECHGPTRSCDATFGLDYVVLTVHIKYEDLPHWKEIIDPARELARSFLVDSSPSQSRMQGNY